MKFDLADPIQLTNPERDLVTFVRSIRAGDNLTDAVHIFLTSTLRKHLTLQEILSAISQSLLLFDLLHAAWIGIEVCYSI